MLGTKLAILNSCALAGGPCGVLRLIKFASSAFRPIGVASLHAYDPDEDDCRAHGAFFCCLWCGKNIHSHSSPILQLWPGTLLAALRECLENICSSMSFTFSSVVSPLTCLSHHPAGLSALVRLLLFDWQKTSCTFTHKVVIPCGVFLNRFLGVFLVPDLLS